MSNRIDWLVSELNVVGGAETFLRQTAPRLRRAGWDLHVISLVKGGEIVEELRQEQVPIIELGVQNKADWSVYFRLLQLWQEDRPDLVHTHLYHAGILGRLAARRLGIQPVIVHQHGPEYKRSRFRTLLDRITSPLVTRYITTCQAVADNLHAREGIPAEKIQVIYNGISIPEAPSRARPEHWPVPDGAIGLACVGRLLVEKGQLTLLEALAQIKPERRPYTVFIGDGPMYDWLTLQSVEMDLDDDVYFIGVRRDVPDILPHFDLFVLPSEWEGISLALLEAMAASLPVIATNVGGTPEVVIDGTEHPDGETGLLVPPGNPAALATAIVSLMGDPERRKRMGEAGRQRVEQHFSLDQTIENLSELYHLCLQSPSSTSSPA